MDLPAEACGFQRGGDGENGAKGVGIGREAEPVHEGEVTQHQGVGAVAGEGGE